MEQIIAIVTMHSISCYFLNDYKEKMITRMCLGLQEMITSKKSTKQFSDFFPG